MMRIAHVFFQLDFGGVERIIVDLSNFLQENAHCVKIIVSHKTGRMAKQLNQNIELIQLPQTGRLISLIKHLQDVDICHIHSTNLNPFYVWGASMANVPVIINTIHASIQYPYSAYCDYIICPSSFIKQHQSRIHDIKIVYNGIKWANRIHEAIRKSPRTSKKIVIAEVRRPNKEIFWSIADIISDLKQKGINVEGWVIGEEGVSNDSVHYFGVVPQPMNLLAKADFLLHLSKHDVLPNAVLEAMYCGAIPIASAVGGIPEVIQHQKSGFLISSDHLTKKHAINFVSDILNQFLTNPTLFESIRKNAKQRISTHFHFEQMASQILSIYKVLNAKRHPRRCTSLAQLVQSPAEKVNSNFLAALETFCFDPQKGLKRMQSLDFNILTPPQKGFLLCIFASQAIERQEWHLAKQLLQHAVELWYDDFYLHLHLGLCAKSIQQSEVAEKHLKLAIERMPDEIEPYFILLDLLISQNAFDKIIDVGAQLLSRLSSDHPMHPAIAVLLNQARVYNKRRSMYQPTA